MKHTIEKVEDFIASLESARGIPGRLTPIPREMLVDLVEEVKWQRKIVHVQSVQITNLKEENKRLRETLEKYENNKTD